MEDLYDLKCELNENRSQKKLVWQTKMWALGIDWKFSEMLKIQWFTIEKMIKKNYEGRDLWET